MTLCVPLPRGEAAVEGFLVAAVDRQHRVEPLQRDRVDRLLVGVGVAVGDEQALEKLEEVSRNADAPQAVEQPPLIDLGIEQLR